MRSTGVRLSKVSVFTLAVRNIIWFYVCETSLLSRGLNFCSVPGPINETKLLEELDNFARSLRIKEHFGSKAMRSTGVRLSKVSVFTLAVRNIIWFYVFYE
jgi:hypothetical protein